jgi:hypothetical protein
LIPLWGSFNWPGAYCTVQVAHVPPGANTGLGLDATVTASTAATAIITDASFAFNTEKIKSVVIKNSYCVVLLCPTTLTSDFVVADVKKRSGNVTLTAIDQALPLLEHNR